MKSVFVLFHTHEFENGEEFVRTIGIYSTKKKAIYGRMRFSGLSGFKNCMKGFHIERYELNKDNWKNGVFYISEFDEYEEYLKKEEGKDCFDKILELGMEIDEFKNNINSSKLLKNKKELIVKTELLNYILKIIFHDSYNYIISFEITEKNMKDINGETNKFLVFKLTISRLQGQLITDVKKLCKFEPRSKTKEETGERYVFELMHTLKLTNGEDSGSLIGIYSTEKEAEKAREKASKLAGFRDDIGGFRITCYEIDKDYWTEGYVYTSNFNRYRKHVAEKDGTDCFDKLLVLARKTCQIKKTINQSVMEYTKKFESVFDIIGIILDNHDLYQISYEIEYYPTPTKDGLKNTGDLPAFVLKITNPENKYLQKNTSIK